MQNNTWYAGNPEVVEPLDGSVAQGMLTGTYELFLTPLPRIKQETCDFPMITLL